MEVSKVTKHVKYTRITILGYISRSNLRLCSAFEMLAIEEQRATCNLPCVKNCHFPHAGDVSTEHLRSSSVSNVIKAVKAVTAFFYGSLIGASYDSKRHKAIVAQDQITRKTCKWMVCQYAHCPRWVSPRVPSLKASLCRQWLHDRNTRKVPPTPLE